MCGGVAKTDTNVTGGSAQKLEASANLSPTGLSVYSFCLLACFLSFLLASLRIRSRRAANPDADPSSAHLFKHCLAGLATISSSAFPLGRYVRLGWVKAEMCCTFSVNRVRLGLVRLATGP